jgi:hypothetical protein
MFSHFTCCSRRGLAAWTAGAMALVGCALLLAPFSPAQGKKKEAKKAELDPVTLEKAIAARPGDKVSSFREQVDFINQQIEKGWLDNKVLPSPRCNDYDFIRRASLDLVGRIPTIAEIEKYFRDPEDARRTKLVDRLVESRECAENFANIWTVMLLTRTGSSKVFKEQLREWLTDELQGTPQQPPDWTRTTTALLTATGDTNKNGAVNYILHHVGEEIKQDQEINGKWDMVPVTSRTTRLFLGIRTQCVQCHDHPFNGEWNQQHFWGINAFFRQVDTNGRPTMMQQKKKVKGAPVQQFEVRDNPGLNVKGLIPYERRNAVLFMTDAKFLDGKGMPKNAQVTRREQLAKYITKSPAFAKAFVNRMWGHFMGKSFTKDAVDDFGDHNPESHPELLKYLAEEWVKYNHNPKVVLQWICNSRAYGLSSVANRFNDKPEDETLFARMLLKPMTPEQMFDSLMTATQAKAAQSKDDKLALREGWLDLLTANFGNDEGEEGTFSGTVVQALLLMNGTDLNRAVMDKDNGTVALVLKKRFFTKDAAPAAIAELYLAALSRPPITNRPIPSFKHLPPLRDPAGQHDEVSDLLSPRMFTLSRVPNALNNPNFWTGYYQDIFWALLNSNEFILNH